jgi:thymidylate synthase
MKYCETFEKQYINLIDDIMKNGKLRADRTGTGTISLFGKNLNIDVSKYFPLLTTKRVFFRGVVEELLFFISGKTDTKILENRGVNIWKGNTSREFLDGRNLKHYEVGEYGPSYGYNWRFYGKKYKDDSSVGVDQLQNAIDLIKNDPTSRRIIVSAWNPSILNEIPLPACHYIFQFYVDNENLSILVNMRSCDVFLGLPFNIASYSLLLYMVSHITNKKPKDVIFMLGDTHIYQNHLKQCTEQISRFMKELPTLEFSRDVNNIDDFTIDDFLLKNYNPCSNIKADMAI